MREPQILRESVGGRQLNLRIRAGPEILRREEEPAERLPKKRTAARLQVQLRLHRLEPGQVQQVHRNLAILLRWQGRRFRQAGQLARPE